MGKTMTEDEAYDTALRDVLRMMAESEDGDWDFLIYQIERLLAERAKLRKQ